MLRFSALLRALLATSLLLRFGAGCGQGHLASRSVEHPILPNDADVSDALVDTGAPPSTSSRSAANGSSSPFFFDDFSSGVLSTSWMALTRHGDYGNGELQCYLPGNVSIAGGNLVISSLQATQTCGDSTHAAATSAYTSGMVQWARLQFTYGTLEFRAKMAGGRGTWPALWLLGSNCQASNVRTADNAGNCNWPNAGSEEIDVTEILNSDHVHVNQALHSGAINTNCTATVADVTQNWHVYQLVWTAQSLVWNIDGTQTCKLSSGVPSTPMFVIVNTAIGGAGGSVNPSTLPQTTSVDYIEITQP